MKFSSQPDYIALRVPGKSDLIWYDKSTFPETEPVIGKSVTDGFGVEIEFQATGTFVSRSDGAVAEIWEPLRSAFTA